MGAVVRLSERSTDNIQTSADVMRAGTLELPIRTARCQIAQTTTACEMSRQSIATLQRDIKNLERMVGAIRDQGTREKFQRQLSSANQSLLLGLAELSRVDDMLQVALLRTYRPTGG